MAEKKDYSERQDWWTAPATDDTGDLVMVSGRRDVARFRNNPRFKIRIEVTWKYGDSGMPSVADSELMEQAQEAFTETFGQDPVAVLTGVYTGGGERNWIFYTLSTNIFGRKLNEALSHLPQLPLNIYAENDPDWEEYAEMSLAEVRAPEA